MASGEGVAPHPRPLPEEEGKFALRPGFAVAEDRIDCLGILAIDGRFALSLGSRCGSRKLEAEELFRRAVKSDEVIAVGAVPQDAEAGQRAGGGRIDAVVQMRILVDLNLVGSLTVGDRQYGMGQVCRELEL